MVSHSVFLGAGESHLLPFVSTFGFGKLLSWMKCLYLVCLISFTKWVSEAQMGKADILSLRAVHICLLSSQRNWQENDELPVLSSGFILLAHFTRPVRRLWFPALMWVCVVFCFVLFVLIDHLCIPFYKQTNLILGTDVILCALCKVGLKPGSIGEKEEW